MALTGGAASRTPLLGGDSTSSRSSYSIPVPAKWGKTASAVPTAPIQSATPANTNEFFQTNVAGLLDRLSGERDERFSQGLSVLQDVADLFGPGYLKGQEQTALAAAEQNLVGRGLGGSTRSGAISGGMRANFEDIRKSRLADALSNVAQYIQGATPTAGDISHLATGGFSGLSGLLMSQMQMGQQAQQYQQGLDFNYAQLAEQIRQFNEKLNANNTSNEAYYF